MENLLIQKYKVNADAGILNTGYLGRIERVIEKAKRGEKCKIAFLGGSVTQGCNSSRPETCYAYLTFKWWKKNFPNAEFEYINAGIGATDSRLGAARVEQDVLSKTPDFMIAEFAVNDESNDEFLESYEGLVRRILKYTPEVALLCLCNARMDNGCSSTRIHLKLAKRYNVPCVSMQSSLYPAIVNGKLEPENISTDYLHPNDEGHKLVSEIIINFLDKVKNGSINGDEKRDLESPLTENRFEHADRFRNVNCNPILEGFRADTEVQTEIKDCFKLGWLGEHTGDSITFKMECTGFMAQFRRYAKRPGLKAKAVVDNDEKNAVLLDGDFYEDWGDKLDLFKVAEKLSFKEHTLTITLTKAADDGTPFNLISILTLK